MLALNRCRTECCGLEISGWLIRNACRRLSAILTGRWRQQLAIDRAVRICYALALIVSTRGTSMRVGDVITDPPVWIRLTSNLHHAAEIVALSGVSDLMVS